jgi:ribosomal protein S18 acetylase RimI-like enzyme
LATAENRTLVLTDGRSVVVRTVELGDGPGIRRFFESLGEASRRLFCPHPYTDDVLARRIDRAVNGDDLVYVALAEGCVVAYFFLWRVRDLVPLLGIGIADSWQSCGLGQQLMSVLIEDARALGKDGIELTTMLDNDRAFHVYQKLGFQYYGDVENEVGDGTIVVERGMFLPLREGAQRSQVMHECPE